VELLSIAILWAATQTTQRAVISASSVDVWTCRSSHPDAELVHSQTRSADTWRWLCRPGIVIACDAPSHEPVDLTAVTCGDARLLDHPVRRVSLSTDDSRPGSIEWRQPGARETALVAVRELAPNSNTPRDIVVSQSERVLRIRRTGAAPLSIFFAAGSGDRALTVPGAEAGGELVFFGTAGTGQIVALEVTGQSPTRLDLLSTASFARARLFQGQYVGRLTFSSGLASDPVAFEIRDSDTTELARERFGRFSELVIEAESGIEPYLPARLALYRITRIGNATTREMVWRQPTPESTLQWRIDGLRPGTYEAVLSATQPIASTVIEVPDESVVQARLASPTVEVFGSLYFGDLVAPEGTTIRFESDKQRYETTTDARGGYRVKGGKPGKYTARVQSAKYLWTWTESVALVDGPNRFDWKVPGGSLALTLRRQDGAPLTETVQLQCSARGFHTAGPILADEAAEAVVLVGLPLDSVKCSADTKSGLVSDEMIVRLTPTSPSVRSTLRLRMLTGKLELRNVAGGPLSGARAIVGNVILEEDPAGSGQYTLSRNIPGAGMLITAPGHLPMCRQLSEADYPLLRLTMLDAGNLPVAIRLTPRATRAPGLLFGVPGSECPLPLFAFDPALRNVGANSTDIRFVLPAGTYQYQPYGLFPLQTLTVPGPVLELTRPK